MALIIFVFGAAFFAVVFFTGADFLAATLFAFTGVFVPFALEAVFFTTGFFAAVVFTTFAAFTVFFAGTFFFVVAILTSSKSFHFHYLLFEFQRLTFDVQPSTFDSRRRRAALAIRISNVRNDNWWLPCARRQDATSTLIKTGFIFISASFHIVSLPAGHRARRVDG
jgi:hypothetical protein